MKAKNRHKYTQHEQNDISMLASMGHNPTDIYTLSALRDSRRTRNRVNIKSKQLRAVLRKIKPKFVRTVSGRTTSFSEGCWLTPNSQDEHVVNSFLYPLVIGLIKCGTVTDIQQSGNNQ